METNICWDKLSTKYKNLFLKKFIENIIEQEEYIENDDIVKNKNKFFLLTLKNILLKNIKEIDDKNIIFKDNNIIEIKGINRNTDGLLYIDSEKLYKNRLKRKNKKIDFG